MKKVVTISFDVEVEIDESKFDERFMSEFRESFYCFYTIDEHLCHLAQLYARGLIEDGQFIEGYGPAKEMGISFNLSGQTEEVEEE